MTGLDITEIDRAEGVDFDAFVAVHAAVVHEIVPEDPPPTAPEVEAEYLRSQRVRGRRSWVARQRGQPVAALSIELPHEANEVELRPELWVAADARRRRVGSTLLREGLEAAADGRDRIGAWVDTDAGVAMCRWLGLEHRQTERCSRLQIADLDPAQQTRWIDDAPGRAEGYEVVSWRGPCPDTHIEPYCAALDAMRDMPVDDLDYDFAPTTPDDVREIEASYGDAHEPFASLAIGPDGDGAGMTMLWANRNRQTLAYQDDTAVVAANRGHALGRWLKAANLRHLLEHRPQVRTIETYNAESNPWMLAINVDMGFTPFRAHKAFQGPLDTALRVLEGRT